MKENPIHTVLGAELMPPTERSPGRCDASGGHCPTAAWYQVASHEQHAPEAKRVQNVCGRHVAGAVLELTAWGSVVVSRNWGASGR